LALSFHYYSEYMDYGQYLSTIPWIDIGLCVAGIYGYVDTDFRYGTAARV
jgi:hypothetical protein